MSDASSIRKATTLPAAQGFYRGGVRWNNNQAVVSTGTQWAPLGNVVQTVRFPVSADAVTQPVFIADRPYSVISVTESHSVVGGSGAAVTVEKAAPGVAPGSGLNMIGGPGSLSLTGTINNPQNSNGILLGAAAGATPATCTAVLSSTGSVASITVNTPGTGYSAAAAVYISAPAASSAFGGTQATATATAVSGGITSVTITYAGSGYDVPPQVIPLYSSQLNTNDTLGLVFLGTTAGVDGTVTIVLQPL